MIGVYQLPQSLGGVKIIARNYYDGSIHVSYELPDGEFGVAAGVSAEAGKLTFTLPDMDVVLEKTPGGFTGTVRQDDREETFSGVIAPITDAEDRTYKCSYKKKALIMYATITKNTERIAKAFAESFEHYGWQADPSVTRFRSESICSTRTIRLRHSSSGRSTPTASVAYPPVHDSGGERCTVRLRHGSDHLRLGDAPQVCNGRASHGAVGGIC